MFRVFSFFFRDEEEESWNLFFLQKSEKEFLQKEWRGDTFNGKVTLPKFSQERGG